MKAFYCGVWPGESSGHFVYPPSGWPSWLDSKQTKAREHGCPFDDLDSETYLSRGARPNGRAKLTHTDKGGKRWTVIAIHDNTGDDRPGSHSTFAFEGEWSFSTGMQLAQRWFPAVLKRLADAGVQVTEWAPEVPG